MQVRVRQGRSERGWWAIAARMLALVLALALAAPGAGLAADLSFHAGGHPARSDGPAIEATAAAATAADPGLAEHLHCGCHQAARLDAGPPPPPAVAGRPLHAGLARALPSIIPDRLPRPPRA